MPGTTACPQIISNTTGPVGLCKSELLKNLEKAIVYDFYALFVLGTAGLKTPHTRFHQDSWEKEEYSRRHLSADVKVRKKQGLCCRLLTGRQPPTAATDRPGQKWHEQQDEMLVLKDGQVYQRDGLPSPACQLR